MTEEKQTSRPNCFTDTNREYFTKWLEGLERLFDERDLRYQQRFQAQEDAVKSALAAQKELNASVASASDKAISKAEEAQSAYNQRSNEFRSALDDQGKLMSVTMLPRSECDSRHNATDQRLTSVQGRFDERIEDLKKEVALLRESKSQIEGRGVQRGENQDNNRFVIGLVVVAVSSLISLFLTVIHLLTGG